MDIVQERLSREFDLDNLDDRYIHLTNDAIQKRADDFGKFESYNKMSFQDFQKFGQRRSIVPQLPR